MNEQDFAILLTPPGAGAIAVVRLLGPGVRAFLAAHFSRETRIGRCAHGTLTDTSRVIDDPVIVLLPDGGADVNLHGGPWVIRSMLQLAQRAGFAVAQAADAPDALDGSNILEREVQAAIPLARTELGLQVLLRQVDCWNRWLREVPTEAAINHVLLDQSLRHLLHPPKVAIVGAANVGKSTLANQLFGQERSITADMPGTTRDWVGAMANVNGLPVLLVDTPGMRSTEDAIEHAAIEASRAVIGESELVVLVIDSTRPLAGEQLALLAAYPQAVCVVNKCDRGDAQRPLPVGALRTVALTGQGIDALRGVIAAHFQCADIDLTLPRCWTQRQRALLRRALRQPDALREFNASTGNAGGLGSV